MDVIAVLRRDPSSTAICLDFDGTLSEIVPDAASARPLPGVPELLGSLADKFAQVAIVSGRPVSFLATHLPPRLSLHGLYGLESVVGGEQTVLPEAERWRSTVDAAAERASHEVPEGVEIEHKGLSLTIHSRRAAAAAADARAWAIAAAERTGLVLRAAKMSLELHPPVEADKGTVVRSVARGMSAACYIGDDEGDLPAFDALDVLAAAGCAAVKVAVRTAEASSELVRRADAVVDGPGAAVALLERLA